jgi:hypothetical protein
MTLRAALAPLERLAAVGCLFGLAACQNMDSFDTTKGDAAYCGPIIDARFVRTVTGGFDHDALMHLEVDASHLNSFPGNITTNDKGCDGLPTFNGSEIRVQEELKHDPLSLMTFEDGQVQNVIGWVNNCRGSVMVIVSLLKTDRVDVRLLEPKDHFESESSTDVFSVFTLTRNEGGCGF